MDAAETGANEGSPEKEIHIVEKLIAHSVDAGAGAPDTPESLQSTFRTLREAGRVTVTHEAGIELSDDTAPRETIAEKPPLKAAKVKATKR